MSTNVKRFVNFMRAEAEEIRGPKLVTFQKKIVLDVLGRIVSKTPVDTGLARSNWQLNVGNPGYTELPLRSEEEQTSDNISELAKMQPFQTSYINNNVEYISYLEDGSSDKAPNGMVAISLAEVSNTREE